MIACLIVASVLSAPPPPSVDVDRILVKVAECYESSTIASESGHSVTP